MKGFALTLGLLICCAAGEPALAAGMQPPMNSFNDAYYTCDANGAFLLSYDSKKPTKATMTTSNNQKKYELKRTAVATGVQFAGDNAKFWTDGKTVVVDGTETPFSNCKMKPN